MVVGRLAPSADVEKEWRSAKSKPRSWNEIDDLIAMTVATADASAVPSAAAPVPIRRLRTRSRHTVSSAPRLLLESWWRGLRGVARPAD
jgi:hypothetical protein